MKNKFKCILLVDDDHATNYIHRKILEKSGIVENVKVALNGQEALDFIEINNEIEKRGEVSELPSVIFLDINMPVLDGWEFLEEYDKLKMFKKEKTIIIMMSTSFNPDDEIKAKGINHVTCYKSKPMTLDIIDEIKNNIYEISKVAG